MDGIVVMVSDTYLVFAYLDGLSSEVHLAPGFRSQLNGSLPGIMTLRLQSPQIWGNLQMMNRSHGAE